MSQPLLSLRELIVQSWRSYLAHWNDSLHVSYVVTVPALVGLLLIYGLRGVASANTLASMVGVMDVLTSLALIWVVVRLNQMYLRQEGGSGVTSEPLPLFSAPLYLSVLWIGLLEGLAVFGGCIFLILPGIWLALSLSFAQLFLLDDGLRGVKALAASAALVKGRWWGTLKRLLGSAIVFSVPISIVFFVLMLVVYAGVGGDVTSQIMSAQNGTPIASSGFAVAASVDMFLQSLMQAIALPLLLVAQVKLFKSLKASR